MSGNETGAPTDLRAGCRRPRPRHQARRPADGDPLAALNAGRRETFAAIADLLIPAAHGMPSAADVVGDDRLRFVLRSRPDLVEPLAAALRPSLGDDPQARLDQLARDEPMNLAALQLVLVGGYYTDKRVRELIGYPGQVAIDVRAWEVPAYLEEGLIDAVLARGAGVAGSADRHASGRRRRAADLRRTVLADASVGRKEDTMAATAPESRKPEGEAPGWLDAFLAGWNPGSGEVREVREPATGRPLLSVAQSTR